MHELARFMDRKWAREIDKCAEISVSRYLWLFRHRSSHLSDRSHSTIARGAPKDTCKTNYATASNRRARAVPSWKIGQLRDTYARFGWFSHCYRKVSFRKRNWCDCDAMEHDGDCSEEKSDEIVSRGFLMISRHLHLPERNETRYHARAGISLIKEIPPRKMEYKATRKLEERYS